MNKKTFAIIQQITSYITNVQFVIAIVGFILTIPHLLILTRKSMRSSSTNSIMTGIAILDLVVLLEVVLEHVYYFWIYDNPCINHSNYNFELFLWIGDFLKDTGERASFWMGVFLVLIRLLITKFKTAQRLSGYFFGYAVFTLTFIINVLISYYFYSKFYLQAWMVPWQPGKRCSEFPKGYSENLYVRTIQDQASYMAVFGNYSIIGGMSKILISVLYPVLAVFLIFDIRKSAKHASTANSKKAAKERYHTGRMILLMAVLYTITSAPGGISKFITLYCKVPDGSILMLLIGYGSIFLSALFCLNSASHCLINFSMSTNYRKAAKMVFFANRKQSSTSVLSVTRSISKTM